MGDIMDKVNIRECKYEDLIKVEKLQRKWANEDITYGFVPAKLSYLESKLGKYFLVAELDNNIIGFVYGTIHEAKNMSIIPNGQFYIEIDDIYILEESRKKGVGSILLDKILEVAKENGIEKSLVYSATKDMENVIDFYKKHNYKTWYIQMFKD